MRSLALRAGALDYIPLSIHDADDVGTNAPPASVASLLDRAGRGGDARGAR